MKISLVSNSYVSIVELAFLGLQFGALTYMLFFPQTFPLYQVYCSLVATNFASLFLNMNQICHSTERKLSDYFSAFVQLVSMTSLVVLTFAVYEIQLRAA